MAQGRLECGAGHGVIENLSHWAQLAREVWPDRFPTVASAEPCAHNPARHATTISIDLPATTKEAQFDALTRKIAGRAVGLPSRAVGPAASALVGACRKPRTSPENHRRWRPIVLGRRETVVYRDEGSAPGDRIRD
jgi:hypothetical protein